MFFTLLAFLASVSTAGGDSTPLPSSRSHTCTSRKNALLPLPSSVHPAANFEPFDSALLEKAKSDVSVNRACREGFSHSTYEYIVERISSEGHGLGYPLSWFCEEILQQQYLPPVAAPTCPPTPGGDNDSTLLSTSSVDTVPSTQTWSHLKKTTMVKKAREEEASFLLHRTDIGPEVLLGESKWGLFFTSPPTDTVLGIADEGPFGVECDYYVDTPVVMFTILTWQVGHLIVDVLEPLFYMLGMNKTGEVKKDVILVIDVAEEGEKDTLFEKILRDVYETSTPFFLLKQFTSHPIHTKQSFFEGRGGKTTRTCLEELYVELDVHETYYTTGWDSHPGFVKGSGGVRDYAGFQKFLWKGVGLETTGEAQTVTFVERTGHRELLNLGDLQRVAGDLVDRPIVTAKLEAMGLEEQVELFGRTRILISQYGSGAHNSVFLSPGSVLILLMQPGWCNHAWAYANQALLSRVGVVAVCAEEVFPDAFRWTWKAWHQGPWNTKDMSWAVEGELFAEALQKAQELVGLEEPQVVVLGATESAVDPASASAGRRRVGRTTVHLSNYQISRVGEEDAQLARLMCVFEVVLGEGAREERHWDDDQARLCVEVNSAAITCRRASEFNEFSTVDIQVPFGTEVNIRAFLEGMEEESETYFWVIVEGLVGGLNLSTITHVGSVGDGVNQLNDFRLFRGKGDFALIVDGLVFETDLGEPYRLQRDAALFCRANSIDCGLFFRELSKIVQQQNELRRLNLPKIQYIPTVTSPFIFLHHEKTAGSSLRRYIAQKSSDLGLGFYIPCYTADGVYHEDFSCYSFDLHNASKVNGGERDDLAVVAGHMQWDVWAGEDGMKSFSGRTPNCLVMLRHPVDRAISLFYERVFPRDDLDFGNTKINELSPTRLKFVVEQFRGSAWGMYRDEGFSNTLCKMLLGQNHFKGKTPSELNWEDIERADKAMMEDVERAIENLDQCVVGLQNDWETTKSMIWHFFPWLEFNDSAKMNTGRGGGAETRDELRSELERVILNYNQCDMKVWEHAQKRFELQKRAVLGM
ncbi:hypothetical protein TrST_g7074 [Triparma strigata]|uniref:Glycosyltransferase 61 catalytic domain-containing protein n=1 Tax=Triparma strigata TaxID=1606541 RepID=A0A9W7BUQ9_9STRA|nr:hypothetical protein TrST_g7074 [Triparma strigata]